MLVRSRALLLLGLVKNPLVRSQVRRVPVLPIKHQRDATRCSALEEKTDRVGGPRCDGAAVTGGRDGGDERGEARVETADDSVQRL